MSEISGGNDAFVAAHSAGTAHPTANGLDNVNYVDDWYPGVELDESNGSVTPVLSGKMTPVSDAGHVESAESRDVTVAWAFERHDGGRSFSFTGGHNLSLFDTDSIRRLLLNSILWVSKQNVPDEGAMTSAPSDLTADFLNPRRDEGPFTVSVMTRPEENGVMELDWGRIDWHVTGPLGNSDTLTTGIATVDVGKSNPRHYHPNCDEVLHVLQGKILHTMNEVTVEMQAGDTVSIPKGVYHNATNIGDEKAVLAISFDSAWREVIGE